MLMTVVQTKYMDGGLILGHAREMLSSRLPKRAGLFMVTADGGFDETVGLAE